MTEHPLTRPAMRNDPSLKPGYWWWNVAPLGDRPIWEQCPMPADVRPGEIDKILGYETKVFMARQYTPR